MPLAMRLCFLNKPDQNYHALRIHTCTRPRAHTREHNQTRPVFTTTPKRKGQAECMKTANFFQEHCTCAALRRGTIGYRVNGRATASDSRANKEAAACRAIKGNQSVGYIEVQAPTDPESTRQKSGEKGPDKKSVAKQKMATL